MAAKCRSSPSDRGETTDDFGVSSQQLLINQRVSQAAIKRLNIVVALRAGEPELVFTNDTRDTVEASRAQLIINQRIAQTAVRRANGLAGIPTPPRNARDASKMRLTADQLRINQKISQAAVRRANVLLRAERDAN